MRGIRISAAPEAVIVADHGRFGDLEVETVIQRSGLHSLTPDTVRGFCHWFVGKGYGWKESRSTDEWRQGYGNRQLLECLADHLGMIPDVRLRRPALHTTCKAGPHNGKPYYWTPYIAVDIDLRDHHTVASLNERYHRCVSAFGTKPVVLRSPGRGLHVYFPLAVPISTFGLTHTLKTDAAVLVATALLAAGISVRPGWAEVYPTATHTLRMPLAWGMTQLDPDTLVPLPALTRADEVSRLVASMDSAAVAALDPFGLAARLQAQRPTRGASRVKSTTIPSVTTTPEPVDDREESPIEVDVDRLEQEGLYPGVTRNEAALAIARRRILTLGWSSDGRFAQGAAPSTVGWSAGPKSSAQPSMTCWLREAWGSLLPRSLPRSGKQ